MILKADESRLRKLARRAYGVTQEQSLSLSRSLPQRCIKLSKDAAFDVRFVATFVHAVIFASISRDLSFIPAYSHRVPVDWKSSVLSRAANYLSRGFLSNLHGRALGRRSIGFLKTFVSPGEDRLRDSPRKPAASIFGFQ